MHTVIVVMGVSGCGKSSVGEEMAARLGGIFVDADDLHGAENVAHMAAGKPLNDEMRWPWLDRCIEKVNQLRQDAPAIIACSALKRIYREHLRNGVADMSVVYLDADRDLVMSRLSEREGHYMPVSLLDSQFATLEVPSGEKGTITVSIDNSVEGIVSDALQQLAIS